MVTINATTSKKHSGSDTGYADWGWRDFLSADRFTVRRLENLILEVSFLNPIEDVDVRSITLTLPQSTASAIAGAILSVTQGDIESLEGRL